MNQEIAQEILHELFSSLEALDTKSTAILQFLKDKGIATEKDLAPYLEQAGNASNVRWLAARVRIDHLLSSAMQAPEDEVKKQSAKPRENSQESSRKAEPEESLKKEMEIEKPAPTPSQSTPGEKPESGAADDGKDRKDRTGLGKKAANTEQNAGKDVA